MLLVFIGCILLIKSLSCKVVITRWNTKSSTEKTTQTQKPQYTQISLSLERELYRRDNTLNSISHRVANTNSKNLQSGMHFFYCH
jgi:hypothetical protein